MLSAILLTIDVGPAAACSCSGPPSLAVEFTGEANTSTGVVAAGRLWTFRATVDSPTVRRGDVVEVVVDGQEPPDANGVQQSSSCSIGPSPVTGGTYAVGAYRGENPEGTSRYFANGCGGYLRELAAAPPTTAVEATTPRSPTSSERDEIPLLPAAAAGLAVVAAAFLAGRHFQSR